MAPPLILPAANAAPATTGAQDRIAAAAATAAAAAAAGGPPLSASDAALLATEVAAEEEAAFDDALAVYYASLSSAPSSSAPALPPPLESADGAAAPPPPPLQTGPPPPPLSLGVSDPWFPQGPLGGFFHLGLATWQEQRAAWTHRRPGYRHPPTPPAFDLEDYIDELTDLTREVILPGPVRLPYMIEMLQDAWSSVSDTDSDSDW